MTKLWKKEIESPDYDYVMWKALRGDSTDNIKGIKGVGDKTAHKLISNPELLKEFLSDITKRDIFDRNVNLIRLVNLVEAEDEMEITSARFDVDGLQLYFSELGFDSMLKEKTWKILFKNISKF